MAEPTPLRPRRADLEALAKGVKAVFFEHGPPVTLAEALGVLEVVKLELYRDQTDD